MLSLLLDIGLVCKLWWELLKHALQPVAGCCWGLSMHPLVLTMQGGITSTASAQEYTHHHHAMPAWSALNRMHQQTPVCMHLQANALDSIWWCKRCEQLHRGCSSGLLSSSCSCDNAHRHEGKAWHREAQDSGSCGKETRPQAAVAAPRCRSNSSGRQAERQTPVGTTPLLSLVLKQHTAQCKLGAAQALLASGWTWIS